MDEVLFTEAEAARYLTVAAATLERWRRDGRGPAHLQLGRLIRYRREDLDSFLSRARRAPAGAPR